MADFYKKQTVQWASIGIGGAILFILGMAGFARYSAWHNLAYSFWDDLYLTFQLISFNSGSVAPPIPLELNLARFLFPLLAGLAGLKAIWQLFNQQIRMIQLTTVKDQVIVCGLSRKGYLLARRFRQRGDPVVVIENDEENDWLESCRKLGMFVLLGDAADPTLLAAAGVNRARAVFAVCDDDGINTEIALAIKNLAKPDRDKPLVCLLHVADPRLCALLRQQEASLDSPAFRLELFNVFERGARQLLYEYPAWDEGSLIKKSTPHLLVIGLGRMGENLLLHAARDWWFQHADPTRRLRVTVIDRRAVQKVESLAIRYPYLNRACDINPLQMEIRSPEFERASFLVDERGQGSIDRIYVCIDDDSLGLHTGLVLLHHLPNDEIPVIIRMAEEAGLARLLEEGKNGSGSYSNLYAFGYLDHTCTPDLIYQTPRDILARTAYEEINRTLRQAGHHPGPDAARPAWDKLARLERQIYFRWVDGLIDFLKEAGIKFQSSDQWDAPAFAFSKDDLERLSINAYSSQALTPGEDHWMNFIWRCQGINPGLPRKKDWDSLPDTTKDQARSAVMAIPGFFNRAGFQLE